MIKNVTEVRHAVTRGAVAGLAAGIFLTIMMTVMSAAKGKDVWYGIKGAAAPFLGESAMQPGFDLPAVALGLVTHLVISAGWAALFALLFYGAGRLVTIAVGILWGFVVWIGMYYAVLPVVGLSSMQHDAPPARAIAFHLLFSGAMTAAYFAYPHLFGDGRHRGEDHMHRPASAI
jgi:hypothetical protein